MTNMHWNLHTREAVVANGIRKSLEASRDMYMQRSMPNEAGVQAMFEEQRDPNVTDPMIIGITLSQFRRAHRTYTEDERSAARAQMDTAIKAAAVIADTLPDEPLMASIYGHVHPEPTGGETGDTVTVTVQVAAK